MLKIALIFFLISIISLSILGYFLYKDINDIRTNLQTKEILLLLEENNKFVAGASIYKNNPTLISQKEITKQDFSKYYKLIIINTKFLENILPEKIELEKNQILTKQEIINIIKSEDPLKLLSNPSIIKTLELNIKGFNSNDPANIRTLLVLNLLKDIDPIVLIKEYQKGNIKIIEETITFKILKQVPADYIYSKIRSLN